MKEQEKDMIFSVVVSVEFISEVFLDYQRKHEEHQKKLISQLDDIFFFYL